MADRVSVSITLGGALPAALIDAFETVIRAERLSTEWDGTPFDRAEIMGDAPLKMMAHEVSGGTLDELEDFCVTHGLSFARWADAYPGGWEAERLVFAGSGEPQSYRVDGEDRLVVDRDTVVALGSLDAILAHFDAGDIAIPALRIV